MPARVFRCKLFYSPTTFNQDFNGKKQSFKPTPYQEKSLTLGRNIRYFRHQWIQGEMNQKQLTKVEMENDQR